jgi:hypothetical protein
VTGLAVHAAGDVRLVIELHVIWQHMDADPFDGLSVGIGLTQLFDAVFVGRDLLVTVHTGRKSRNIRAFRKLHLVMAVLTLDFILPDMQLVAERQRLLG